MSLSMFLSSMIKFKYEFRLKCEKNIHFFTKEMTLADAFYPDFIYCIPYKCCCMSFKKKKKKKKKLGIEVLETTCQIKCHLACSYHL